jgi:hypothetical protein
MLLEAILEVSCCYYSQLWCADKESMDVWIWRVRVMKILEVDWMNSLGQTTARLSSFSTNEPSQSNYWNFRGPCYRILREHAEDPGCRELTTTIT